MSIDTILYSQCICFELFSFKVAHIAAHFHASFKLENCTKNKHEIFLQYV